MHVMHQLLLVWYVVCVFDELCWRFGDIFLTKYFQENGLQMPPQVCHEGTKNRGGKKLLFIPIFTVIPVRVEIPVIPLKFHSTPHEAAVHSLVQR